MTADQTGVVTWKVGETLRVRGLYVQHWEWSRFEIPQPRRHRWFSSRPVLCRLEPREGIAPTVADAAGVWVPRDRRNPVVYFDVVADVTPVEEGHFGHRGTLHWRFRVEEWVWVQQLDEQPGS